MSGQTYYSPPREQLVNVLKTKTISPNFKKASLLVGILGLLPFVIGIFTGNARAWQAFHVNWLFFTGLAGGSLALTAVYKLANAKWAGLIQRFAQPAAAFLPVSLVGLLAIFTAG